MSKSFWCDYGNHAAKYDEHVITINKPGQEIVIRDQFGNHMGQVPGEQVELCNDCAVEIGLSNNVTPVSPTERHAAIEASVKGK